mmetsp:Transcript_4879/g.4759  ORF Transcript_4879/g.4759 Transcript_4879/m.4759 type:complete len:416 (+) Transcript_4879:3-1250(+)
MIKISLRLLRRFSSSDLYSIDTYEKIRKIGTDYDDARAYDAFSMKEFKKHVTPEEWAKITANDPLFKMPELEDLWDIQDLKPHFYKHLPPYLQRPAIALDERQRAAKRMTLEWAKGEKDLKKKRIAIKSTWRMLTNDECEVFSGLMLVRNPIWAIGHDKDVEWAKLRFRTMRKHGLLAKFDDSFEYEEELGEESKDVRMLQLEKNLDEGKPIKGYKPVPNSKHWLEADPDETDPHSIGYAGGYRVWLLLRNKVTQRWEFPSASVFGMNSFNQTKINLMENLFGKDLKVYHITPKPFIVDTEAYPEVTERDRPINFDEDVYDLYLNRLKILMPKAKEEDLIKMLEKKYEMKKNLDPLIKKVKGRKIFYFRSVHEKGDIKLVNNDIYDDFAWVPKVKLSKYLEKERFDKFIQVMTRH